MKKLFFTLVFLGCAFYLMAAAGGIDVRGRSELTGQEQFTQRMEEMLYLYDYVGIGTGDGKEQSVDIQYGIFHTDGFNLDTGHVPEHFVFSIFGQSSSVSIIFTDSAFYSTTRMSGYYDLRFFRTQDADESADFRRRFLQAVTGARTRNGWTINPRDLLPSN